MTARMPLAGLPPAASQAAKTAAGARVTETRPAAALLSDLDRCDSHAALLALKARLSLAGVHLSRAEEAALRAAELRMEGA